MSHVKHLGLQKKCSCQDMNQNPHGLLALARGGLTSWIIVLAHYFYFSNTATKKLNITAKSCIILSLRFILITWKAELQQGETERASVHWFTLQMAMMARARPNSSLESGAFSRSPMWPRGLKDLGHLCFPRHNNSPGPHGTPTSQAASSFTHYTTMPVPLHYISTCPVTLRNIKHLTVFESKAKNMHKLNLHHGETGGNTLLKRDLNNVQTTILAYEWTNKINKS